MAATGREAATGNFVSLSCPSPFLSPIATGWEGPIVATRGGQGATVPKRLSAGLKRGFD